MKTMTWLAAPLAVAVAGCGQDVFGSPRTATTAGHVTLTEHAGSGTPAIIAAAAPAPATMQIPARPSPPPGGAISYQRAEYQRQQTRWNGELAAQNLLTAGAARAAMLGTEATQAQLGQLVTDGLTAQQLTETGVRADAIRQRQHDATPSRRACPDAAARVRLVR